MSGSLRVTLNTAAVSPSRTIARVAREVARTKPLICLTGRLFRDLMAELGGIEAAMRHLLQVAEDIGQPIAINFSAGEETSRTAFLAPRSWTPERLQGWIGGHHETVEAMFGAATVVLPEDL